MRTLRLALGAWALALAVGLCQASPTTAQITIFNTGVDAFGTPISGGGVVDPHYFYVSGRVASPTGGTSAVTYGTTPSTWTAPSDARWVERAAGGQSTGDWTYYTTFEFASGLDPASFFLSGSWSSDNLGYGVYLNGLQLSGSTNSTAFSALHAFSASGSNTAVRDALVYGTNTLAFQYNNSGGPGGVLVSGVSASANELPPSTVPEPASLLLLASGLAGLAGARGRARREV